MRQTYLFAVAMLFTACCGKPKQTLDLMKAEDFRTTVDGKQTELYTLTNGTLTMQVTNFGARVVSLWMPDRNGNMAFRREAFDRVGLFNPQLGRNGKSLVGGEENDLFARLRRG